MLVYIVLFFLIFIFGKCRVRFSSAAFGERKNYGEDRYQKNYVIAICVLLTLLLFLKHDMVGNDTHSYRKIYEAISQNGNISYIFKNQYILGNGMEITYLYLYLLFARMHIPFRIMMLIFAAFYIRAVGKLIYRYSDIKWLSFLLFILTGYFFFFTANRQALAMAFTMYSFMDMCDGKKVKPLIYAILGCLFHTSALIYLAYYVFKNIRWTKNKVYMLALIIILMFVYHEWITEIFLHLIGREDYGASEAGGIPIIVMFVLMTVLGLVYMKSVVLTDKIMMSIFTMIVLVMFTMPFSIYNAFFYRLRHYFAVYMIIYLPNIIYRAKIRKMLPLAATLFVFAYSAYVFFGIGQTYQSTRTIPYVFFWEPYPADKIEIFTGNVDLTPKW